MFFNFGLKSIRVNQCNQWEVILLFVAILIIDADE